MGWDRRFEDPIPLPDGTRLTTLKQAIEYLARTVPKKEQNMPQVLTASTILSYAAEREAAWMFMARAATLQAIHRNDAPRPFNPDRKDPYWGKRKLKRDQ